jgi:hypothetical protein
MQKVKQQHNICNWPAMHAPVAVSAGFLLSRHSTVDWISCAARVRATARL